MITICNFRELRKSINKTQKEVSNDTGIPLRTLQRYEQGANIGDPEYLCLLMRYFGIDAEQLLPKNGE